jgi:lipopolysaccharide export system permease protein
VETSARLRRWFKSAGTSFLIIDRYISLEIIRPFCAGLGLLVLVFIGYSAAAQLSLAAEGQMDMSSAFQLIFLNTLITLEILLPSAFFFSVLAAIGRMYRDAEMNALYAAGVSRARILESVFKLAAVAALITGYISIEARPWAFRESYRLEAEATAKFDLKKMATGEFVTMGASDYIFIADDIDLTRGQHKNVFLQKTHDKDKYAEIIVARSASLPALNPGASMTAEFFDGYNYLLDGRNTRDVTMRFRHMTIHLQNSEAQERYRRKAETTLNLSGSDEPKDIAEFQWRLSTPLATLLLGLVAVPLGRSAPRESRFRRFFMAIGIYVAMLSMISVARTGVEQGTLAPLPGLWVAYIPMFLLLLALLNPLRWRLR